MPRNGASGVSAVMAWEDAFACNKAVAFAGHSAPLDEIHRKAMAESHGKIWESLSLFIVFMGNMQKSGNDYKKYGKTIKKIMLFMTDDPF